MSSIVTAVFKATIGLLVNKGRDKVAEILKDGDVTDQKIHALIVREIDDVKSKLDALSRKDLEASISFFEEGIALLYEVFERSRSEYGAVTAQAACDEAFSLVEGIRRLELTGLDESATRTLSNAKERFKDARRKATEAFKNEGLKTSDRILAMQYRVMATILETVDHPTNAVAPCRVCIKELNCLPAVQNSFDVQLKKGIQAVRGLFSKEERREIISGVCRVNRAIFDVTQTLGRGGFCNWPTVDSGKQKVDPLDDRRLTNVLCKEDMAPFRVTPWSFGQEGEEEHKLKDPWGIATNSSGQFIVADNGGDRNVKVFDGSGKFIKHFRIPTDDLDTMLRYILDVATDMNDNIYVLANLEKPFCWKAFCLYKFTKTGDMHYKSLLCEGDCYGLSVSDSGKVLVLRWQGRKHIVGKGVDEYETDGQFVRSFGEGILEHAWDITAANDGRVMVVGTGCESYVHIFSELGDHLNKFKLQGYYLSPIIVIAFHRASEHVVVAGVGIESGFLCVEISTKDGQFVRSTQIHEEGILSVRGITVTTEGRIAVVANYFPRNNKLLVL